VAKFRKKAKGGKWQTKLVRGGEVLKKFAQSIFIDIMARFLN